MTECHDLHKLFSGSRPGETPSLKTFSEPPLCWKLDDNDFVDRSSFGSMSSPVIGSPAKEVRRETGQISRDGPSMKELDEKYDESAKSGRDAVVQPVLGFKLQVKRKGRAGAAIIDPTQQQIVDNAVVGEGVDSQLARQMAENYYQQIVSRRFEQRRPALAQVAVHNRFSVLPDEPGVKERLVPLVKYKWGKPVGRSEQQASRAVQRHEHEHFLGKRAKHQEQRITQAVSRVTSVSGSLLPTHHIAKREPEVKVSVIAAETTSVSGKVDLGDKELPRGNQELVIGDDDWSESFISRRHMLVHGMDGSRVPPLRLVEHVEPPVPDNLEVNLIDNRDLRTINVKMAKYKYDHLSFLGVWNDTPLSSSGQIYADHYGLHLAQSLNEIELPSTLVSELMGFWVNRRRDSDLKEFNLSVIRCRKLCSEMILTAEQYRTALYYAPMIAYKDSWDAQQEVSRLVTGDYWQVLRQPIAVTKFVEFCKLGGGSWIKWIAFLLAPASAGAVAALVRLPVDTVNCVFVAPVMEEWLKRRGNVWKHASIWFEFLCYVKLYGLSSIPMRLAVVVMHYLAAHLSMRNGVILHTIWNICACIHNARKSGASMLDYVKLVPGLLCYGAGCVRFLFGVFLRSGWSAMKESAFSPGQAAILPAITAVLSGTATATYNLVNSNCSAPKELKPTARVKLVVSEDRRLRQKDADQLTGNVAELAFNTGSYKPTAYAPNLHNEKQALDARVLAETPVPEGFYCGCLHRHKKHTTYSQCKNARFKRLDDYVNFAMGNLHKLIDIHGVVPLSIDEYLEGSHASPPVKKLLRETYDRLTVEGIDCHTKLTRAQLHLWTMRKSFVKVENNLYQTEAGVKDKAPRLIQGATPEFIVLVGPWIAALQKRLKKRWNKHNPLCFTSGLSAKDLGTFADRPGWKIIEDDVSAWDTSIRKQLCEMEVFMCKSFGAPIAVLDLMTANISTHGITMHGWKYKVEGTRKSGDPFTSLFNSVHNALLHLFIYCEIGVPLQQALKEVAMIVAGDDNLLLHRWTVHINWVYEMRRLGFKSEGILRKSLDEAEFCSGRFYCTDQGYYYGPKPGKVLAKFGYVINPPLNATRFGLMRGIALGLERQVCFIPPLKSMVDRVLQITEKVEAEYLSPWLTREAHKVLSDEIAGTTDDIMHALLVQYQWGPTLQKQWERTLAGLSFGDVLCSAEARQLFDRDTSGPQVVFGGFRTAIAA